MLALADSSAVRCRTLTQGLRQKLCLGGYRKSPGALCWEVTLKKSPWSAQSVDYVGCRAFCQRI